MVAKITFASEKNQKSDINKEFVAEFINILAHELISTKFQPIVCLVTGDVVAYEALSRGPEGSIFENPVTFFTGYFGNFFCRERIIFIFYVCNFSQRNIGIRFKGLCNGNLFPG